MSDADTLIVDTCVDGEHLRFLLVGGVIIEVEGLVRKFAFPIGIPRREGRRIDTVRREISTGADDDASHEANPFVRSEREL